MIDVRHELLEAGSLRCRLQVPANGAPDLLMVLCHGYGATGDDLVPIAGELVRASPTLAARCAFAFPEAPLQLSSQPWFDARAWWEIDVNGVQDALARDDLAGLCASTPDGLASARRKLTVAVDRLAGRLDLPLSRVALGGFSQGAMLTTDLALRLEEPPAMLAILSGVLICSPEWRRLAPRRAGLRVFQAHGRTDGVLPYLGATWLHELLVDAGLDVSMTAFGDGHTVPREVVEGLGEHLEQVLARR